ncbi:MAG: flavin reductase [Oscillospiraceae bacterium]|jgi:flavin reductase (DIM6/NTAB) family NADH-FMN oxidoreductase RutF|nr:flavin reductase [Oscillospiraceae bacterium]
MKNFKQITPESLNSNPFELIGKDWALLSSGTPENFNTMTISWGAVGIMWNKPVAFTFVRPQRYTMEFVIGNDYVSLCFFDEKYRKALAFCGSNSGRDFDKPKETGLTPAFCDGVPYFEEAKLVLVCKKLYNQFLNAESVVEPTVTDNYAAGDYHKMFVNEIVEFFVKE